MSDTSSTPSPFEAAYPFVLWIFLGVGFVSFVSLFFIQAPYGKHSEGSGKGWGPKFSGKFGFMIQETPAVFLPPIYYYLSDRRQAQLILLIIWEIHYIQRTFISTILQPTNNKNTSFSIMIFALIFQFANTYLVFFGICFRDKELFDINMFKDPFVILGFIIFFCAYVGNIISDTILRRLRKPGDTNYYIPHGFLFEFISAPNYFCEMLEWFGYMIGTKFHVGTIAFFVWTIYSLFPRALGHHQWYKKKFGSEYPSNRKAIIPFIL
ncbi:MAG: putative 3-oxo-5-alpha-steroid 4-dehydrogenase [Streblomastix strix]|uniref:Putative 3-oxo-5-alpha-steroid 4-dehydrogenase n=1 Tax=Streblomastix strix TaxID=222440 RepID=A0A5J4WJ75_9EUKA|nr:MAG: putative 3-oxo-5-alpha-steroid 4-dehydrogenase [Streblomastix strix]